jgi:hypothetical protein
MGYTAGDALTNGAQNTAIGVNFLGTNISGTSNVAVGSSSLQSSTGSQNTAIGNGAGCAVTTGTGHVYVGYLAGSTSTSSCNNTFVGWNSGGTTTGACNTFIGNNSGSAVTTGSCNTLVGRYTGTTTLANNIVLSDGAGTIRFQANSTGAISFDGTNFGTAGQTLQSNGTAAVPTWVTPIWQNLTTLTLTSTTLTTLLSVSAATFRGVVINLSVSDVTGGDFHTDTLQVNHDGTTANVQVIGGSHIGPAPYTASAAITAGNLVVSVTSATTNSTKYVGNYTTFAI